MADKSQNLTPSLGDSDLPALRAFVGGYLHEDFREEYESPAAALDAYFREASHHEIVELESDLDSFLEKMRKMPFADAKALFVRELRSGWSPPNRAALARLLELVRTELRKK